ncbi:uncharacterized protein BX663DRAFT_476262 [Cokeromyces recurvatus]|uniref:uncharacterized protein n=1 Tax=Cokeromyces recurvatus TaxID=90255 RepID=UPI0022211949|nr:uncharacterized protein BX663DRAFT_476262 [Cokeromyces recurvatus]KAI7900765.1 hypothetical protein BX663DRAFT_476262 [Cokeromyces recurvatus]
MAPPVTEEVIFTDHVHSWEEIVHYATINKYGSVENYLLKEKIHFSSDSNFLILPNDFPYSIDPGIEHVLIWSKEPLAADFVESLLEKNYGSSVWEWVYFVNPPELQSIPRLPHVHVFMRKRITASHDDDVHI